jgi:trigger factor
LKVETQELENHQSKITVEVEPSVLEEAKHRAASRLARRTKIPGFRPGKAPYAMIVRHLGEAAIFEEAVEIVVDDIYPKAIDESGIKPFGPGSLEEIKQLDPLTLEFVVPRAATVQLGDYHAISIPYEAKQISDEEVDRVVKNLRNQNAVVELVERPAQVGDQVALHISGEFTAPEEGENPTFMDKRELTLIVEDEEESIYQDLPFPGFTNHLAGLSAGEDSSVAYKFPEDSAVKYMAGKEAAFTFTVDQVSSRTLPEINDELAQSIGDYATMEVLRKAILDDLQKEADETYNEDYDRKVLDQLVEMSTVEYPPQMLDREIDVVINQLESRLQQQGMDMDLYLKTRSMNAEQLREETKPVAETRLKRSLVLFEVAEKEDIEVDPQQLQNETLRTMDLYSRMMPAKDFKRLTTKDATNNLIGNIMMELVIENTKERLRNFARGIEVEAKPAVGEAEAESVDSADPVIAAEETNQPDAKSGNIPANETTTPSDSEAMASELTQEITPNEE